MEKGKKGESKRGKARGGRGRLWREKLNIGRKAGKESGKGIGGTKL